MPYGLQVRNSGGDIILDTTYRITRVHATITHQLLLSPGFFYIPVPGMRLDGTWAVSTSNNFLELVPETNRIRGYYMLYGGTVIRATKIQILRY